MQLLRGDESRPTAAVSQVTGLPPGVVLQADDLQDVPSLEGHRCVLARDSRVLARVVVKKSLHKELRRKCIFFTKDIISSSVSSHMLASRLTNDHNHWT